MDFNKEIFEKALKANKIVRYQKHFEAVVKSYLEIYKQELNNAAVSGLLHKADGFKYMCSECGKGYDCVDCGCPRCNDR